MSRKAFNVVDNRPARTSMTVTFASASDQRVENLHLIGDRGDVDNFGDVGMKAFERTARGFGVEGARRHVMRDEIIEQRAGDRGLPHTAFVRPDQNNCWLHDFPTDATQR